MTTSLLVRTLRQLSAKDLRALPQWVRCGVINRREDVALLCEYLCGQIGKAGDAQSRGNRFSSETLYAAACPGKAFDDKQLRHIMSFLLGAIRQYLAWDEWQGNEAETQRYLLRAFRRRRLDQQFERTVENGEEVFQEGPLRDTQFHLNRYLYLQEKATYFEDATGLPQESLSEELTVFYISGILRDACHVRSQNPAARIDYRIDLHNVILKIAGRQEMLQIPAIAVYYHTFRMLDAPMEDEPMEQLKASLKVHESRFAPDEIRYLYQLVIQGCIRRMNAGRRLYAREAFGLYKHALAHHFLLENGRLSGNTYKNIVQVATGLEEYEWTENFIEQYKNHLPPRERDDQYRFNLGYLRFRQKMYGQALTLLQKIEFEDVINELDTKRTLVQVCMALNQRQNLESELNRLSQYLQKQKNLGALGAAHENLVCYIRKLMETDASDRQALSRLHAEISSRNDVAEKSWLLEQCA